MASSDMDAIIGGCVAGGLVLLVIKCKSGACSGSPQHPHPGGSSTHWGILFTRLVEVTISVECIRVVTVDVTLMHTGKWFDCSMERIEERVSPSGQERNGS
ncbi:hypothetical protein RRG08_001737 [Elysia crispata]|uniref:Uncharacterized protein n=1 Tax=Elysia crispata TaxID=231223 RepID=A0AAE1AK06_9GAST|nr:hypothetical protein RRG08_001737 [Elysia crispata]